MPGMMKKKKDMRMSYMEGKEVKRKKMMYGSRKPMSKGTRYGMSDGGPAVKASMQTQKPN